MRRGVLWLLPLAMVGCASWGEQLPAPVSDAPSVLDTLALCEEAARLSTREEHKPAVDIFTLATEAGGDCPPHVLATIDRSRHRLRQADELVRQGLAERAHGDLVAAQESFRGALAIYPKYYWVQKFERDLGDEISAELAHTRAVELDRHRSEIADSHVDQARSAQLDGALDEAVNWVGKAIQVHPTDPVVRGRVVDLARGLGLNLFSSGELMRARTLWNAALSLEPDDERLRGYLEQVEVRLRHLDEIKRDHPRP